MQSKPDLMSAEDELRYGMVILVGRLLRRRSLRRGRLILHSPLLDINEGAPRDVRYR